MASEDVNEKPVPDTSLTASTHPRCDVCSQPATGYCKHCRNMWYCSSGCLPSDKRLHEGLCESFAGLQDRPAQDGRSYYRVIYFPVVEDSPRFVWLEHFGGRVVVKPNPVHITKLIGGRYENYMRFDCHCELRRQLGYQIEIICGAQFAYDGSNSNISLRYLLPWKLADLWAGSFLARGVQSSGGLPVDLETGALPSILTYLKWMIVCHSVYAKKVYALGTVTGDEFDPPNGQWQGQELAHVAEQSRKDNYVSR